MVQDILKRPVKVGDTVLTTGYYSAVLDTVVKVDKIGKDSIFVNLPASFYDRVQCMYVHGTKRMKRSSAQFVIIDEQLAYNKDVYPEYYI